MRVLVFGSNGQVGGELLRIGARAGIEVIGVDRRRCDLTASGAARAVIESGHPDVIINAAAYTAVDKAEGEPGLAAKINAEAPGEMALAAAAGRVPIVHFSTDYVFDGEARRPYRESDPTSPLGAYGATKLRGEDAVRSAGGAHAIIRLSWVFSAHGANFVKTMLRLAGERPSLRVVADQHGKPTPAADAAEAGLAAARALLQNAGLSGVYHYAGDETTTWADFAAAIMDEAGLATPVERIGTKDYPTPARRPAYSVLDTAKFERTFGMKAPSWRAGLRDVVKRLSAESVR